MTSGLYSRGESGRSGNFAVVGLPPAINQKWSFETPFDFAVTPIASQDRIWTAAYDLFESKTIVYCFDTASGQCLWQQDFAGKVVESLNLTSGGLVIPFFNGRLISVDPFSGAILWDKSGPGASIAFLEMVAHDRVLLFARTAECEPLPLLIDTVDGSETRSFSFKSAGFGGSMSLPPASDGKMLVLIYGSDVAAFSLDTGEKKWQHTFAGSVLSGPAIVDSSVFVGDSYYVTQFDAGSGNIVRQFEIDHGRFGKKDNCLPVSVAGDFLFAGLDSSCLQIFSLSSGIVVTSLKAVAGYVIADGSLWANFWESDGFDNSAGRLSRKMEIFEIDLMTFTRKRGPFHGCSSSPVFGESVLICQNGSTLTTFF